MKKHLLLFTVFICIVSFGYSQSLEDLGDAAFINGKYQEAEELYIQAKNLEQSNTSLDAKIEKARTLKNEFSIIDNAIFARDYNQAETHLKAVLKIDPGNLWVAEKRRQIKAQKKEDKKERYRPDFSGIHIHFPRIKGLNGNNFNMKNPSGLGISLGIRYDDLEDMLVPMIKLSYLNYNRFPFTVDYTYQLLPYPDNIKLHGFGIGSAFLLSSHWSIDYGLGVYVSIPKYIPVQQDPGFERYLAMYARAGVTYRCCQDHLGLSLYWHRGFKKNYPFDTVTGTFFVLTYLI